MRAADIAVLRGLASRVAEIAALPSQRETIELWKATNALRPVRPMVMIDQVPWHEMNVDDELTLRTEDAFARELETELRRTLYQWAHMRADMVVRPLIQVPKVITHDGFGASKVEETLAQDAQNDIVSHRYTDQFPEAGDERKIRSPTVTLDVAATAQREAAAHEALDGILDVQMQGLLPSYELWDQIVEMRTPELVLFDLADRPEHMMAIAEAWSAAWLAYLDRLESDGLLGYNQASIHCTGAFTDELPKDGFDPAKPRAKDLWTYGMAQILGSVSHTMSEEFELPFAARWYSRFGLGYYGCCDPLHNKIDLVRRIPNVRKISISPWANLEKAAERIGGDYVLSRKPNPAPLAMDSWDVEAALGEVRRSIEVTRSSGTPIEVILKDVSTVRREPQRLWDWERRAMQVARDA
jgi:hypothetical protein